MKKLRGLIFVLVLVLLDQFTKYFAKLNLEDTNPLTIIDGVFQLQYLENSGAAFGVFKDQILAFVILTIFTLFVILFIYNRIPELKRYTPLRYILIFISAGAIGNLIDRIRYNYVVDFFYFELIDFPIFNVADCYVSISAVLLVILFIFYYKEEDFDFINIKKDKKA